MHHRLASPTHQVTHHSTGIPEDGSSKIEARYIVHVSKLEVSATAARRISTRLCVAMLLHTRALVRRCCLPTQRCCQPSFRGVARPWAVKTANAAPRLDTSTRSYVSTSRCTCSGSDGSGGGEVWRGAHYARPSDVQRHVFSVDVQHQLGHSDPRTVVAEAFGSPTDQPVVFLHGGGQNRWTWERTALEIAPRGFYVVTVDMKGHGMPTGTRLAAGAPVLYRAHANRGHSR